MARSLGLEAHGPVTGSSELPVVLRRAVDAARAGSSVVVDVVVDTADYPGCRSWAPPLPDRRP